MIHAPIPTARPPRRLLGALLALAVLAAGTTAAAASTIDPSKISTASGTVWQFLVDHSARKPAATCYRSTSHPSEEFTCLVVALQVTGLDAELRTDDHVTIFAPTDAGFASLASNLGARSFAALMRNPDDLKVILEGMMVRGRYTSSTLRARAVGATGRVRLPTLGGGELQLRFSRFPSASGQVEVEVGTATQERWKAYLVGRTTLLHNGSVIPVDMVVVPPDLR